MIYTAEFKKCRRCLVEKSVDNFSPCKVNKDELASYCKDCNNVKNRIRRANLTEEQREARRNYNNQHYYKDHENIRERQVWYRLKIRYGLTKEQYFEILENQNGVCAICEQKCKTNQRLVVDHCHKTSVVRGLLCKSCNMQLGVLEKDQWMDKALSYLGLQ